MIYVGTYSEPSPGTIDADVHIATHTNWQGQASVFGVPEADIKLNGSITGGHGTVNGSSPQAPGVKFTAELQRYCD